MRPKKIIGPPERLPGMGGNRKYYPCDNGQFYMQKELAVFAGKSQGYFNRAINIFGYNHPRILDPSWAPFAEIAKKRSTLKDMNGKASWKTKVNYDQAVDIVIAMIEDAKHNISLYYGRDDINCEKRQWCDDSIRFLLNKNGGLEDLLGMIGIFDVSEALMALAEFVNIATHGGETNGASMGVV